MASTGFEVGLDQVLDIRTETPIAQADTTRIGRLIKACRHGYRYFVADVAHAPTTLQTALSLETGKLFLLDGTGE